MKNMRTLHLVILSEEAVAKKRLENHLQGTEIWLTYVNMEP